MSVNIHRIVNCPICQTQITVKIIDFQGKIQITCNRCDGVMINWSDQDLDREKNFVKTGSNPRMQRSHTAKRIPIQQPENVHQEKEVEQVNEKTKVPNEKIKVPKVKTSSETKKNVPFPFSNNTLERIGDYRILKQINRGSMGEIFLAQHVGIKNFAAIKLLSPKMEKDPLASERFKQEARVHSRLEHVNIVRIYDVDSYNGRPYIVMEYIEGQSLAEVLRNRKLLLPKHTFKIAVAVALALEHALKQKIIHRDLKPANIMIDKRNRKVKLADFGLGKILEEKGATVTGQMMGTAYYMAPEQVHSAKEVDHRADIYSLGATMYHMLSGQPPYGKIKGALDILKAKINEDPEPLETFSSGFSQKITDMIVKSMARDVEKRYQSPTAMIKAMEDVLKDL